MFNQFTEFLPKQPEFGCSSPISLSELPSDVKRMLRIQAKTFIDYIEDADRLTSRIAAVRYLERCLRASRKGSGSNWREY